MKRKFNVFICIVLCFLELLALTSCSSEKQQPQSSSSDELLSSESEAEPTLPFVSSEIVEKYVKFCGEPVGLMILNGNLIFTESSSNKIIQYSADEKTISVLAGCDSDVDLYVDSDADKSSFSEPTFIIYNSKLKQIIFSDTANNAVRLITADNKVYTLTYAKESPFSKPLGIISDGSDGYYVADSNNHCVKHIDKKGNVTVIAGSNGKSGYADGTASDALFNTPAGLALSSDGILYVADSGNNLIRTVDLKTKAVKTIAGNASVPDEVFGGFEGSDSEGAALSAGFNCPYGIALSSDNTLYIADKLNSKIKALSPDGTVTDIFKNYNNDDFTLLNQPASFYIENNFLYVSDTGNGAILKINLDKLGNLEE